MEGLRFLDPETGQEPTSLLEQSDGGVDARLEQLLVGSLAVPPPLLDLCPALAWPVPLPCLARAPTLAWPVPLTTLAWPVPPPLHS